MSDHPNFFSSLISDPETILKVCGVFFVYYIIASFLFIHYGHKSWLRKNGLFDIFTSAATMVIALLLIVSLFAVAAEKDTAISYLLTYYFLFIFLFAGIYAIIDWHTPDQISGVDPQASWSNEVRYFIFSLQAQTAFGYTRVQPKTLIMELLTSAQGLLGLFFSIIFIARAVNKMG